MQYQTIFFDLDGTLTDPGTGITNSVAHALKYYNIAVSERSELYKFIGPPLIESFQLFYGFSRERAAEAVNYYREYYSKNGIFENYVYDGMEALLRDLKAAGKQLVVATSKPELFAGQILEHFGLAEYFAYIAGANMDESRTKKAEVIAYALDTCGITDKSSVLMVGDREHDVLGAREVGIDCLGVLYGYGDREELEQAGADYIAENVAELRRFLLS